MPRRQPTVDGDSQPVMVPRSEKPLGPVASERVRRLREHLIGILQNLRKARHLEYFASPLRPPANRLSCHRRPNRLFLCRGHCCRNGDDDAFLDDRTLARVRLANPDMSEHALMRLYLSRVPDAAFRNSCIFHGKQGCTIDRSMRADVCNTYYCGGLGGFMRSRVEAGPTVVLAGEGEEMRVSSILNPGGSAA
jgi:hypothetical protein